MINPKIIKLFHVAPGDKARLKQRDTGWAQTAEMSEAAAGQAGQIVLAGAL